MLWALSFAKTFGIVWKSPTMCYKSSFTFHLKISFLVLFFKIDGSKKAGKYSN